MHCSGGATTAVRILERISKEGPVVRSVGREKGRRQKTLVWFGPDRSWCFTNGTMTAGDLFHCIPTLSHTVHGERETQRYERFIVVCFPMETTGRFIDMVLIKSTHIRISLIHNFC